MAKLSSLDRAFVSEAKIVDYLLNQDHSGGRAKAFFLAKFGFNAATWRLLREAIIAHAAANEITESHRTEFGTRYEIDGPLVAPDGRNPIVRMVWFVADEESFPRLVTLVPRRVVP